MIFYFLLLAREAKRVWNLYDSLKDFEQAPKKSQKEGLIHIQKTIGMVIQNLQGII